MVTFFPGEMFSDKITRQQCTSVDFARLYCTVQSGHFLFYHTALNTYGNCNFEWNDCISILYYLPKSWAWIFSMSRPLSESLSCCISCWSCRLLRSYCPTVSDSSAIFPSNSATLSSCRAQILRADSSARFAFICSCNQNACFQTILKSKTTQRLVRCVVFILYWP